MSCCCATPTRRDTTPEPYGIDLKNCAIQRSLDDAGRAQARRFGEAFRKHGITHVRLVSSQFCRALETAKLTGLGPVAPLPTLNQVLHQRHRRRCGRPRLRPANS